MRNTPSVRRFAVRAGPSILLLLWLVLGPGCMSAAGVDRKMMQFDTFDSVLADRPAAEAPGLAVVSEYASTAESYKPHSSSTFTRFGAAAPGEEPSPEETSPPAKTKRLMIYTGRFELLVPNVKDSVARFLKRIEDLGGYLQSQDDSKITCRVPASRFQEVVDALPEYGALIRESIRAKDVTKQYLDLQLRTETAEKARARLLALLEKAEKVEDILKIENEVRRLTEEIERFKGELKYLSDQIAFSTIEVEFRANAPEPKPVRGRTRSRFYWINRIGVEHVLEQF